MCKNYVAIIVIDKQQLCCLSTVCGRQLQMYTHWECMRGGVAGTWAKWAATKPSWTWSDSTSARTSSGWVQRAGVRANTLWVCGECAHYKTIQWTLWVCTYTLCRVSVHIIKPLDIHCECAHTHFAEWVCTLYTIHTAALNMYCAIWMLRAHSDKLVNTTRCSGPMECCVIVTGPEWECGTFAFSVRVTMTSSSLTAGTLAASL